MMQQIVAFYKRHVMRKLIVLFMDNKEQIATELSHVLLSE